jgi:hypothetical protein
LHAEESDADHRVLVPCASDARYAEFDVRLPVAVWRDEDPAAEEHSADGRSRRGGGESVRAGKERRKQSDHHPGASAPRTSHARTVAVRSCRSQHFASTWAARTSRAWPGRLAFAEP